MPRTFSLARLLIGITILCAFFGLVVNYPLETGICGLFLFPPAIVWSIFFFIFRNGIYATVVAFLSLALSLILFDPLFPSIGAFLFAGAVLLVKRYIDPFEHPKSDYPR
jgi:hypothetical protein